MSEQEKKEKDKPPALIIHQREDNDTNTTQRAVEYHLRNSQINKRIDSFDEFFNVNARQAFGDRFMDRQDVRALVIQLTTDLRVTLGKGGLADKEPLTHENLVNGDWFLSQYQALRTSYSKINNTKKPRVYDYGYKGEGAIYAPGEIMRFGEDNKETVWFGRQALIIMHHHASRSFYQVQTENRIFFPKEALVEKEASWNKPTPEIQKPTTPTS